MFVNPESLIDQTIENLHLISQLLNDDADELIHAATSHEVLKSRDAMLAIDFLVPKLKTAKEKLRLASAIREARGSLQHRGMCQL